MAHGPPPHIPTPPCTSNALPPRFLLASPSLPPRFSPRFLLASSSLPLRTDTSSKRSPTSSVASRSTNRTRTPTRASATYWTTRTSCATPRTTNSSAASRWYSWSCMVSVSPLAHLVCCSTNGRRSYTKVRCVGCCVRCAVCCIPYAVCCARCTIANTQTPLSSSPSSPSFNGLRSMYKEASWKPCVKHDWEVPEGRR